MFFLANAFSSNSNNMNFKIFPNNGLWYYTLYLPFTIIYHLVDVDLAFEILPKRGGDKENGR